MKKKCFLFVLLIVVLFSFQAVSAETDYTKEADVLNSLGLFNGTTNGYELNRVPTRVESAAMLVRLLGAEKEANEMKYEHPFTDVPEWADNIVGYMYEKGYTKGISDELFGSGQTMTARDYTTFMLRSLGYSSDFNYLEALNFAAKQGIITEDETDNLQTVDFKRNEMVMLSYRTMNANIKDSELKLVEKLFDNGSLNKQEAFNQGLVNHFETVIDGIDSSLNILEINSPVIYVYADKKEISNGTEKGFNDEERKEYFTDGYKGSVCFKFDFPNWEGLNIKYELSFYKDGQFIKQMNYLYDNFNTEHDHWREFITPDDDFNELKIRAYPMKSKEINDDLAGIFEIITTKDVNILKDTILKYGNVHATASGIDENIDINSIDDINVIAWKTIFSGKTVYGNGNVYRPYSHKYIVDGNFKLEFGDEGSSISSEKVITLPKNNMKESLNFILIYDEGLRFAKVFLVK